MVSKLDPLYSKWFKPVFENGFENQTGFKTKLLLWGFLLSNHKQVPWTGFLQQL